MSSAAQYGVLATGFQPKRQSTIIAEINASLASAFGSRVNVSAKSNLGVLTGIYSEREALLWELAEAVFNSAFRSGAEGVAVDNLLALANLTRIAANPTKTNPDPARDDAGVLLHGLVLFGTPGTLIPAGSIVRTAGTSPTSFLIDADVIIQPAQNASQTIVLSRAATSGSLTLSIVDALGDTLATGPIAAPITDTAILAALQALESSDSTFRFTDVSVSTSGTSFTVSFGAVTPATIGGVLQPSSGAMAQPLMSVETSTDFGIPAGEGVTTVANAVVVNSTDGAPAQGVGSATCTVNGPIAVQAGSLVGIGTPISGWTGVNNDLDCVAGSDSESDTQALVRLAGSAANNGNATLGAMQAHVSAVAGVTQVRPFTNRTSCSFQTLSFLPAPTDSSGNYSLRLGAGTTGSIAGNASAAVVQAAINAIPGYNVIVSGNPQYGLSIDYNGSFGGQEQPLMEVAAIPPGITMTPGYGRPAKSFELVVDGGAAAAVAAAILASMPAGIVSYGSPNWISAGSVVAGADTLTLTANDGVQIGNAVVGPGILNETVVTAIGTGSVSVSQPALTTSSGQYVFSTAVSLRDSEGNASMVAFSRPQQILPFVAVALLTDYYNTPGDSSSGANPQALFSPASVATIQNDIVAIGNTVPMGGVIVGQGTGGLIGAFNQVPGIISYSLDVALGSRPATPDASSPTVPANITLLAQQKATFEAVNVEISWS